MTDVVPILTALTALVMAVAALVTALRTRSLVAGSSSDRHGRSGTVTRWEAPTGERVEQEEHGAPAPAPAPATPCPDAGGEAPDPGG